MKPREINIETRNGNFGGLSWPKPGAPRLMCLHGWLDNAASFTPMAPHLQDFDLVALDLSGHGKSDHRPAGARYYMMDNLWDVDAVMDVLEWDECIMLGHSLGGVIASTYAAAAPERVQNLITLDGLGALSAAPEKTAGRIRESLLSVRKTSSGLRDYPNVEAAAKSRQRASGLPFEPALLLSERSLEQADGVYRWRTDPGLNWRSPSLLTEEQVLNILSAVECPTFSIISSEILKMITAETGKRRWSAVKDLKRADIEGHHHFHMDQPEQTAELIIGFLKHLIPGHGSK
jgi:pimeloyl-ACP methyl ester carboxylesterase